MKKYMKKLVKRVLCRKGFIPQHSAVSGKFIQLKMRLSRTIVQ